MSCFIKKITTIIDNSKIELNKKEDILSLLEELKEYIDELKERLEK